MQSIWRIHPADPLRARRLAAALGLDPITAQLLLNRGLTDRAEATRFLRPTLPTLDDPAVLPDMNRGINRLRRAIANREPILVFGDSDVDGLTASVILYEVLRDRGAIVHARQSNRIRDGYGLPRAAVWQICRSSTKLLILVDCGTNQPDEIRLLTDHGLDTIIVDHHVPLDEWAQPYALINPHRAQGAGRELCSAGLAFKVAQALLGADGASRLAAYLDLAALGTLADCSPLMRESRVIVSEGLERIVRSRRQGLQRLCEATQTSAPEPGQVVKRLIPRLNASGRLGDSTAVWKLLLSEGDKQLDEWMTATQTAHETTKQLHRQVMAQAQEQVNRLHFRDQFVMVVSRSGWPQGLMGPLASQLAQRYGRPAIAIAMDEHRGVGSGRSVPLFNLLEALQACQGLLVRFGGHAQACGLMVDRKHLEQFRALVNQQARLSLGSQGLLKTRTMDLELPLNALAPRWVEETERFAPFGHGNPRPTLIIRHLTLTTKSPRTATLSDGTTRVAAKGQFSTLISGRRYDVVASPAVVAGELVLTVSDARGSTAPSGPAQT
jgi:single-stranded-DNA-specific exonuclease